MTDESMTMPLALSLGAEALRADAESSAPGEMLADAERHAEDLAAAEMLEAEAKRLGCDRVYDLAHRLDCPVRLAEALRLEADAYMGRPAIFRTLCLAERTIRLAETEGVEAAERNAAPIFAGIEAAAREDEGALAAAKRLAEIGDDEALPEDRVQANAGSPEDLADVIANAIGAENLRVAEIACEILAAMLRSGSATLGEDLRNRFAEALRLDWSNPI